MFGNNWWYGKSFLSLDLRFRAARITAVAAVALLGVAVAVIAGNCDRVPGALLTLAAFSAVFWFAVWVGQDARRTVRQWREQRPSAAPPTPTRDRGDVAEVFQNLPWMG